MKLILKLREIFQWNISHSFGKGVFRPLYNPSWKVNTSKLILTTGTLPLGIIRVFFRLRMVHAITGNVMGFAKGYFRVLPSEISLQIQGGDVRSEDTSGEKIITADFFDPDEPSPDNLTGKSLYF